MSRRIAIVGGTGPEGRGLALRWARAGEEIIIGSRDAERAQRAAEEVAKAAGTSGRVTGMANADAVAATDVVVLTVPFSGHAEILKQLKTAFRAGTMLIDTTVPLAAAVGGRPTRTLGVWQGSAAEQAAELVPEGVKVVAAFQNVSHEALESASPVDCDVIVCSDDATARQAVCELAERIPNARGVDGGRLENARIVEQLTALLIGINVRYKAHAAGLRITGLPK
ncbi:MAG: NADPH-dependent F420 reductase [Terriglobales bacterium]